MFGLANYSYPEMGFYLNFSNDYSLNFTQIPIDSTIAYWAPSGQYPQISRGTILGELYLVSWWPDTHYKIFHSVDTGYTWTEKYASGDINLYYWGVSYTAGREPGSFYVMRTTGSPDLGNVWLYIDYSSDYGETFTPYFHDLDSAFTGIKTMHYKNIEVVNHPNPFMNQTTFSFYLPSNCSHPVLSIYDLKGKIIRQFDLIGENKLHWKGTDAMGQKVKNGIYLYNIKCNEYNSNFNKLLILH